MFQNLIKLLVSLSKCNILNIKVIFWYFKQKYVSYNIKREAIQKEQQLKLKTLIFSNVITVKQFTDKNRSAKMCPNTIVDEPQWKILITVLSIKHD